jgi:hypothetical protein
MLSPGGSTGRAERIGSALDGIEDAPFEACETSGVGTPCSSGKKSSFSPESEGPLPPSSSGADSGPGPESLPLSPGRCGVSDRFSVSSNGTVPVVLFSNRPLLAGDAAGVHPAYAEFYAFSTLIIAVLSIERANPKVPLSLDAL